MVSSKEKIRKAKIVTIRYFVAILSMAFGVLITAQLRSTPERILNPIAPYASLKDTKEELYKEQNQLKDEIKNLQKSIEQTQKDSENISLTRNELSNLNEKKALAGLTKLNGPGVIVKLDDSTSGNISEDSIAHAADLRDILNLLWSSGAEAISINGQRIVTNTAIDCIVNTVLVNNVRLSTPFQIEAIGNQQHMYDRLNNPTVLANLYKRKADQGLIFEITKNNDITVPIFDGSFEIKTGSSN